MATREHIDLLHAGFDAVAMWQATHPGETLDLEEADLRGVKLPEALIVGAKLHGAEMTGGDFTRSGFFGSDMRGASLSRAKLVEAEMHGVDLSGADLSWADLSGANLRGAKLCGANLEHAKLVGAQLTTADCEGAKLEYADLSGANLKGAKLLDANLKAAILDGTFVAEVEYDIDRMQCAGIHASACYGNPLFRRDVEDQDWLEHYARSHPRTYRIWKLTSDCGRSILRVVLVSLTILAFFGAIYAQPFVELVEVQSTYDGVFTPFYFSIVTFTTLGFGDVTPVSTLGQLVVVAEVFFGYLSLGVLVSILANKVARRA